MPPRVSTSLSSARPVVDLPQPDSPTSDKGLSRPEIKTDLLHRMHFARHAIEQPAAHRKTGHQVAHLHGSARRRLPYRAFRSPPAADREAKNGAADPDPASPQPRNRRQQRLAYTGAAAATKDLLNAAGLYRLTAIHHQHRSAISATTPISWVIKITPSPSPFAERQ